MKGIVVEIATLINAPPHHTTPHVPRHTHYGQVLVVVVVVVLTLVLVLV